VQFLDFKGVAALQDDVVVKFVPQGSGGELRTGKFGKRAEIDAEHSPTNKDEQDEREQSEGDVLLGDRGGGSGSGSGTGEESEGVHITNNCRRETCREEEKKEDSFIEDSTGGGRSE